MSNVSKKLGNTTGGEPEASQSSEKESHGLSGSTRPGLTKCSAGREIVGTWASERSFRQSSRNRFPENRRETLPCNINGRQWTRMRKEYKAEKGKKKGRKGG